MVRSLDKYFPVFLDVRVVEGKTKGIPGRVLLEDFLYKSEMLGETIVVPAMFKSDLVSTPRSTWKIIPPFEYPAVYAAIVHDILYDGEIFDRKKCDAIFYEALKASGEDAWKCWVMYKAVRLGGWASWNDHDKDSVEDTRLDFADANPWYKELINKGE